jgi:hypothetical protein
MKYFKNRRQLDLEGELRASRAHPRADFVEALASEVRSRPPERTRLGRVGLAFALSGLIVVALASFGGIGYASSAASHAVKKPTVAKHVRIANSAARAQYAPFTPKAKPKPAVKTQVAAQTKAKAPAPKAPAVKAAQLPFTGLALWVPLAAGLMLIALGLVLRKRGRRDGSGAH